MRAVHVGRRVADDHHVLRVHGPPVQLLVAAHGHGHQAAAVVAVVAPGVDDEVARVDARVAHLEVAGVLVVAREEADGQPGHREGRIHQFLGAGVALHGVVLRQAPVEVLAVGAAEVRVRGVVRGVAVDLREVAPDERVEAAVDLDLLEVGLDAVQLAQRARHGMHSRAQRVEQGAVDVEEDEHGGAIRRPPRRPCGPLRRGRWPTAWWGARRVRRRGSGGPPPRWCPRGAPRAAP